MSADAPPPFTKSDATDLPTYDGAGAGPSPVTLSVTVGEKGGDVLVSLAPPREHVAPAEKKHTTDRAPVDIVCVIDVSGSMDSAATMPDEEGKQTETQLSILDVVRHAMRTIKATLRPEDRLAIVTFTDNAEVVAPLTFMTDAEKTTMDTRIDALTPLSSTNLWDGLKVAMDLLNGIEQGPAWSSASRRAPRSPPGQHQKKPSTFRRIFGGSGNQPASSSSSAEKPDEAAEAAAQNPPSDRANRIASIMLLTDGMPNVSPPKGELGALQDYFDAHPASFTISTFGFGYNLDSQLLSKLAATGGGQFSFIPDSGMVGTVFVHAVANLMATYSAVSKVALEIPDGAKDVQVLGDVKHVTTSWGVQVELGDIMYGQSREFVVRLPPGSSISGIAATATIAPWTADEGTKVEVTAAARTVSDTPDRAEIKIHALRLEIAATLLDAASRNDPAQDCIDRLRAIATTIRNDPDLANHTHAIALTEDIEGQVLLALEKGEYFKKWGRHYLPSLARAHQRQKCVNFKDAGQLVYGSDSPLFVKERDALDAAFDALPAPKPTRRTYGGRSSGIAVSSMSGMNSRYGPCVHGASKVSLAGSETVKVETLRRGMQVQTAAGVRAVVAVVKTPMDGQALLCTLPGGLQVTPWHPIRVAGTEEWVFPADIVEAKLVPCDAVYSLLLARADRDAEAHAVLMDGEVAVIGLGHGVRDGVLDHAFFGSYDTVVRSVAALPQEEDGVALCAGVRRGVDRRICGFVTENEFVDLVHMTPVSVPVPVSA